MLLYVLDDDVAGCNPDCLCAVPEALFWGFQSHGRQAIWEVIFPALADFFSNLIAEFPLYRREIQLNNNPVAKETHGPSQVLKWEWEVRCTSMSPC